MDEDAPKRSGRPRARVYHVLLSLAVIAMVGVAGAWSSWSMLRTLGGRLNSRTAIHITILSPAIMYAAGKGMRTINPSEALADFMSQQRSTFDLDNIPKDYKGEPVEDSICLMHWRLMQAIGWTWRILGVSHWALHVLAAVLYTALILVLYGLFRLGMGRALSLGLAVWMSLSPALLVICPYLRDFSKAPFLLGALLLMAYLVGRRQTGRSLILWSVALGMAVGLGFGFRQDIALTVPLGLAALLVAAPLETKRRVATRAAAGAVFLAVFVAAGWTPIRGTLLDHGSSTAQAFVQGVSEDAESGLDFGHASYIHHYSYSDSWDFTVVNAYARRTGDTTPMPGLFSAGHGQAGQRLTREYWRAFPGDMVARAVSALCLLPRIPSTLDPNRIWPSRDELNEPVLRDGLRWHRAFARSAAVWGWPVLVMALALWYVAHPRQALFFGGSLLFLGASPSLLYEYRHFFHLAFVPYWAAGVCVSQAVGLTRRAWREPGFGWTALKRVGLFCGLAMGTAAMAIGVQTAARAWQDRGQTRLCAQYASTPVEAWPYTAILRVPLATETDGVLIQPSAPLPGLANTDALPPYEVAGEYLAISFRNVSGPVRMRFAYEDRVFADLSRDIVLPRVLFDEAGSGRFFFPVYQLVWPQPSPDPTARGCFRGIVLSQEAFSAFDGLWRVRDSQTFRLWPFIVVPENTAYFLPHKTGPFDRAVEWLHAEGRRVFMGDLAALPRLYVRWSMLAPSKIHYQDWAEDAIKQVPSIQERVHLLALLLRDAPSRASVAANDIADAARDASSRSTPERAC